MQIENKIRGTMKIFQNVRDGVITIYICRHKQLLTNHLKLSVNNVPKKNTIQNTWTTTRDSQNILLSVFVTKL